MLKRYLVSLMTGVLIFTIASGSFPLFSQTDPNSQTKAAPTADIRVKDAQTAPRRELIVAIELDTAADIGAIIFTLNWDPNAFKFVSKQLAKGLPNGINLTVNDKLTDTGKLGVLMDTTTPFPRGRKTVMTVTFQVAPDAVGGDYQFTFSSQPAIMSVSTIDARLVDTKFTPGKIHINGPTAAQPASQAATQFVGTAPAAQLIVGRVLNDLRFGINRADITIKGPDGKLRTARTNSFGYFMFANLPEGTYTVAAKEKRYAFAARSVEAGSNPSEIEFMEAT